MPRDSESTATKAPIEVQLALQGGGAKMVGLIAALEAIRDFEDEGSIAVTRIAGTSAGAIVGALYAAAVHPREMRSAFAKIKEPPRVPGWLAIVWRIFRNQPLVDLTEFRGVVSDLLKDKSALKNADPRLSAIKNVRGKSRMETRLDALTCVFSALVESQVAITKDVTGAFTIDIDTENIETFSFKMAQSALLNKEEGTGLYDRIKADVAKRLPDFSVVPYQPVELLTIGSSAHVPCPS